MSDGRVRAHYWGIVGLLPIGSVLRKNRMEKLENKKVEVIRRKEFSMYRQGDIHRKGERLRGKKEHPRA